MHPLEEQDGDEGCPNLNAQRVFAGADEGFHLEVLLERLEEEFDLPALLVDRGNSSGTEGQVWMVSRTISRSLSASQTTMRRRS